ncbi:MAG: C39 family peptidase [Pseudomonadales bacterium]
MTGASESRHGVQLWADPGTCDRLPAAFAEVHNSSRVLEQQSFSVPLPDLEPGDMVVPSFSALASEPWQFQCSLNEISLPQVPSKATAQTGPSTVRHAKLATHLDWFEVLEPLARPTLQITTSAAAAHSAHLLGISIRPLHQATPHHTRIATTHTAEPPGISQQQASVDIRGRICSPTALTMVLQHLGLNPDWLTLVEACRDPATGMYGLWPLCILRAAEAGALGMVRTFNSWQDVVPLLAAGLPLVASIRYASGALPGAPMASTAGHLVVVYGVDDDWVLVNDPAAPEHGSVPRRYPREAFERAWFDHRGAGYVLIAPRFL